MNILVSRTEVDDSRQELYAKADRRMQWGKRLVVGGLFVALIGIVVYCVVCFQADANQRMGSTAIANVITNMNWLVIPALGVIGVGTLLWLVGSFIYFVGGLDSDPNGPALYF